MTNQQIAHLLRNVAAAYAIKDEKKHYFQIVAYQKAADAIERNPTQAKDLFQQDKLDDLPGIGPSIRKHLTDLFEKGSVKHFDDILRHAPSSMFPLLDLPTFGPKKAYKLVKHFRLTNPNTVIQDLVALARKGEIAKLEGLGEKSQSDILKAVEEFHLRKGKLGRMVLPYASKLAKQLIDYLKKSKHVKKADPLGSLRRRRETIGDIDIAVASDEPENVISHFVSYPYAERIIEKGDHTSSMITTGGAQIDLMVQPEKSYGSLLQHFTGSKEHNIHLREYALKKGLSLSEYGIKKITEKSRLEKVKDSSETKMYDTEEKFYNALGLSWISPEIREDTGEIELAIKHTLPQLIERKDIKGDFHLHSNYPIEPSHDLGSDSFQTMIDKAKKLRYDYMGFSEHNPSVGNHTEKEICSILERRKIALDNIQKSNKSIRIYNLLETDILTNGDIAIPEAGLQFLDATLVSIHSSLGMSKETMTKRVLKGLSNPKAKILSHPTGRMLNERLGYELNWPEVFAFCKKNKRALEINSWPERLDLPDALVRQAIENGVLLIIDTDSHAVEHMDLMEYGVSVARRGWATKENIVNSWPLQKFSSWLLG